MNRKIIFISVGVGILIICVAVAVIVGMSGKVILPFICFCHLY